jgi:hypothetical protein
MDSAQKRARERRKLDKQREKQIRRKEVQEQGLGPVPVVETEAYLRGERPPEDDEPEAPRTEGDTP